MKQPETPLTREQIEAWRNLGAAYVEHMPDGEAMFTALCDAALRGLARQEGQEPRGCPTPGACSCPQTPAMEATASVDRADALRYRWLRDEAPEESGEMSSVRGSHTPEQIDAAIDAAIGSQSRNTLRPEEKSGEGGK